MCPDVSEKERVTVENVNEKDRVCKHQRLITSHGEMKTTTLSREFSLHVRSRKGLKIDFSVFVCPNFLVRKSFS